MKLTQYLIRIAVVALAVLALAACNLPTTLATPTASLPTLTAAPQDTPAAATATAPIEVTATAQPAEPTVTAIPPTLPPTQPPDDGTGAAPVIVAGNLSGLSETTFGVPEWPNRLIWPAPEAPLPAGYTPPYPDLLLQIGGNLHPVQLDPPGLGAPLALPLNGTEPLAFAPNATSVVIKDPSRTALYRLDGPIVRELPQPTNAYGANYSPDGRYLVLTSQDTFQATVYDLAAGPDSAPIATLTGFNTAAPVYDVTIAPGGQTVAWHARATIQLQDVATGQMGAALSYTDFVSNMRYSPDGSKLAVEVGGQLYIYNLPGAAQIANITLSAPLNSLDWSPDGTLLAGGYAGGLEIWDGSTLVPLLALPGPNGSTAQVTFSPDGRYIVSMHDGNLFGIWRTQ